MKKSLKTIGALGAVAAGTFAAIKLVESKMSENDKKTLHDAEELTEDIYIKVKEDKKKDGGHHQSKFKKIEKGVIIGGIAEHEIKEHKEHKEHKEEKKKDKKEDKKEEKKEKKEKKVKSAVKDAVVAEVIKEEKEKKEKKKTSKKEDK